MNNRRQYYEMPLCSSELLSFPVSDRYPAGRRQHYNLRIIQVIYPIVLMVRCLNSSQRHLPYFGYRKLKRNHFNPFGDRAER